jgi:8-oxo-dGTP pyrophosphatase MutT (NUDIX family)
MNDLFTHLSSRFYLNVPSSEQEGTRLMYHVEQMYFFTLDHLSELVAQFHLPSDFQKQFSLQFFIDQFRVWFTSHPFPFSFSASMFNEIWEEYIEIYKKEIPVSAILLLKPISKKSVGEKGFPSSKPSSSCMVLMVKGKDSGKWGLPKGKRNHGESWYECACRELMEETGWNGLEILNEWGWKPKEVPISIDSLRQPHPPLRSSRDYKTAPRRPQSFELPLQSSSSSSNDPPLLYYLDLHKLACSELQHEILLDRYPPQFKYISSRSPQLKWRIYFVSYDSIQSQIIQIQNSPSSSATTANTATVPLLKKKFGGDEKEISSIEWMDWNKIFFPRPPKKRFFSSPSSSSSFIRIPLTWQLKKYRTLLTKAIQFFLQQQQQHK